VADDVAFVDRRAARRRGGGIMGGRWRTAKRNGEIIIINNISKNNAWANSQTCNYNSEIISSTTGWAVGGMTDRCACTGVGVSVAAEGGTRCEWRATALRIKKRTKSGRVMAGSGAGCINFAIA